MKKLKWLLIPLIGILVGAGVAWATQNWLIPTIGRIGTTQILVTWDNGTILEGINWGMVENSTETPLGQLINITNTGNKPVILDLGWSNLVNIIDLNVVWNYTGTLEPNQSILLQLNQTVTASSETYSYDTWINATAT